MKCSVRTALLLSLRHAACLPAPERRLLLSLHPLNVPAARLLISNNKHMVEPGFRQA